MVVRAATVDDVVAAVRYAADRGLRVGGSGPGSQLVSQPRARRRTPLDVSRLDSTAVDVAAGPPWSVRVPGNGLAAASSGPDLFFFRGPLPRGGGGYLLRGSYGWNSRVLGQHL